MPELPDLQLFSQNLQNEIAGHKLVEINVPVKKNLNVTVATLQKLLENQRLDAVKRVGKELHFVFGNEQVLGLHLMLHGELQFYEDNEVPKFTVLFMVFSNGKNLALSDFQRMATPTLNPEISRAPDALSDDVNLSFFKKLLSSKEASIKNILLDQKIIRGIGNAYADEILWDAGISPFSQGNKIPEKKIEALVASISAVLRNAEKQLRQFHPDIISGEYRDFLNIHGAKIKKSPTGAEVLVKKTGGRKTYYTEEQELFT